MSLKNSNDTIRNRTRDLLESLRVGPENIMVSFSVASLCTRVPIKIALNIRCQHFERAS